MASTRAGGVSYEGARVDWGQRGVWTGQREHVEKGDRPLGPLRGVSYGRERVDWGQSGVWTGHQELVEKGDRPLCPLRGVSYGRERVDWGQSGRSPFSTSSWCGLLDG